MRSFKLDIRTLRASAAGLLCCTLASQACAAAAGDEIFGNGFETGYAIPLTSPDGPDYEYTAQVTIGDQEFALFIDTGSTTLGVAGATCTSGCIGVYPLYSPSASASATGKSASTQYADGSGFSGPIYADTVSAGGGSPSARLDLVEITKATAFFSADEYQGILGLGPQANAEPNTTGFIPVLVGAGLNDVLAFELCDNTGADAGTMWLGGDGSPVAAKYTPLVPIDNANPFYAIDVDALSLGSTVVASNASHTFQQPVIDTGTSLFYVPSSVYTAFKNALQSSAEFKAVFGNNTFATSGPSAGCVSYPGVTDAQVQSMLPSIGLSLPNATSGQPDFTIQASALDTYLYNNGEGQYCLAIQDGGTTDPSTFGDAFMQAFHIVIDVANSRVGFSSPTSCAQPFMRRARTPAKYGPHRPPRPARR